MTAEQIRGYAPLSQTISSNTESEDEDDHLAIAEALERREAMMASTLVRENGLYYPLDETRNLSNHTRNGHNLIRPCRDNIPIMVIDEDLQNDMWKRRDMSNTRRVFLALSVLLCVFTIVVFLYVLPCESSAICPHSVDRNNNSISWDKLEGVG